MKPTIGRIVHYTLTEENAVFIAQHRHGDRHGNGPSGGDVLPAIVVAVWPDEYGPGIPGVNAQVFLDGNDSLWITSAREGTEPGTWAWPARE